MGRRKRVAEHIGTATDGANHAQDATNRQETNSVLHTGSSNGTARSPSREINMEYEAILAEIPPRRRGKTMLQSIWKRAPGDFLRVKSNRLGQPVGRNGLKLSGFIGVVVRFRCPLNYPNFSKVPDSTKLELVNLIQAKFKYSVVLNAWVRKSMSKKFRDYKNELKSSHFYREKSKDFNLKNIPPDVATAQWAYLVDHWCSEKGIKDEERAKKSRAQQKVTHTTGSKSFARVGEEMVGDDGVEVGRIPVFVTTHTRKDGSYLHPEIGDIIEKAMAKKAEKSATPSLDPFKEDIEIMSEILGPQRNGRVKGLGLGPTPSSIFDAFGLNSTTHNSDEEVKKLQETVAQQDSKIANLEKQMALLINMLGQNQGAANSSDVRLATSAHSSHHPGASNQATV